MSGGYCPVEGTATVRLTDGVYEWVQIDERVHVAKEVATSPFLLARYVVDGWCDVIEAYHATRLIARSIGHPEETR